MGSVGVAGVVGRFCSTVASVAVFTAVEADLAEAPVSAAEDAATAFWIRGDLESFVTRPKSRCSMRAAALALPRSCSRFGGVCWGVASLADVLTSAFAGACFPCIAATDLLIALTVSCVALATRAFSA